MTIILVIVRSVFRRSYPIDVAAAGRTSVLAVIVPRLRPREGPGRSTMEIHPVIGIIVIQLVGTVAATLHLVAFRISHKACVGVIRSHGESDRRRIVYAGHLEIRKGVSVAVVFVIVHIPEVDGNIRSPVPAVVAVGAEEPCLRMADAFSQAAGVPLNHRERLGP